jgi:hypothetical protein
MRLSVGTHLGQCEIVAPLRASDAGEVRRSVLRIPDGESCVSTDPGMLPELFPAQGLS